MYIFQHKSKLHPQVQHIFCDSTTPEILKQYLMFIVQGHPKGIVTFETMISAQGRGFTQLKDEYTNMDHNCPSTTHHEILNEKHF